MKALMIYPNCPDTFWSFKHALRFISKKAVHPPVGLLTVASMLPAQWEKRLVDMNVSLLKDSSLEWADYVFISAMAIHREAVKDVIKRAKSKGVKIVAGGPLFTTDYRVFKDVDHYILNEGEETIPMFLEDLANGVPKRVYTSNVFPKLTKTPVPQWDLINMKEYANMNIQYSRGCPFNCEFCDITNLFGREVRTKSKEQVVSELESLYVHGWKGQVFFVDDNFIASKTKLKRGVLPAITEWMKKRKYPFILSTQASINLSDDDKLMEMMVEAGFNAVFIGIETPNEKSLVECGKVHNQNRNMADCVKKIQNAGLEVMAGFILGFDNDLPPVFQKQIEFIQNSGIVTAMVGLLNAPKNTRLYHRLEKEGRILADTSGNNMDYSLNFIPKMNPTRLVEGYRSVLTNIYSIKPYYKRVITFLKAHKPKKKCFRFKMCHIKAFFQSIFVLGIREKGRKQYWELLFWTLFRKPSAFPKAVTMAIYGFHFRKVLKI